MVSIPSTTNAELAVLATAGGGTSSRTTVLVSLVMPEAVTYVQRRTACRVREGVNRGTSVCSLADPDATGYLFFELVDAAADTFWADPTSGTVYTGGTLDREMRSNYRLTARAQLDGIPTQVVPGCSSISVFYAVFSEKLQNFTDVSNKSVVPFTRVAQWLGLSNCVLRTLMSLSAVYFEYVSIQYVINTR